MLRVVAGEGAREEGPDLATGRLRVAIEEQEVEAQWIAREGHHAPELSGADDAYGHRKRVTAASRDPGSTGPWQSARPGIS